MYLLDTNVVSELRRQKPYGAEAFEPKEARRLLNKLEFHYTHKHGSWLNMAEIEFSLLSRQCMRDRMADRGYLTQEVSAWVNNRNSVKSDMK